MATTYVGNFTGNCTIQLNGQAIVVINRGVEINRWPYNCIRQFRAEDESGKFSFVSGRRGPFGVAEYNFILLDDSLVDMQSVLTEFTGAQFSAIAPGSGTEQQSLQPQQPLPPYPPTLPRPSSSSSSNSYTTSFPHHMTTGGGGGGGRVDSTSSEHYPDSVFSSPARPKLPPRDYSTITPAESSSSHQLGYSADEAGIRGLNRTRASTSGSAISYGVDIGSYSSPRPALPPPRREAKEPSPEVPVATSNSYEEELLHNNSQPSAAAGKGKTERPAVPTKKKSFFDRILGGEVEAKGGRKSSKTSLFSEPQADSSEPSHDLTKPHPPPENAVKMNGKPHDAVLDPLPEEDLRVRASRAKKESPYDHLPSQLDISELAGVDASGSAATSPGGSEGTTSPDLVNDSSSLDYIPRSSPTVKTRSITPEHAQHLRKLTAKEGHHGRVSASLHGRRSPGERLEARSGTMGSVGGANRGGNKPAIPSDIREGESLYNVPRSSSPDNVYKVPKSVMDSPPSPRVNGGGEGLYDAPRSSSGGESTYDAPRRSFSGDNTYMAPRHVDSISSSSNGNTAEEAVYKVPSSVLARDESSAESDNVYNLPRSMSGDMLDNAAYNEVRGTLDAGSDSLYNTPRLPGISSPSKDNNYEFIDVDAPRFVTRINPTPLESGDARAMTGYVSGTAFGNKPPKCEYVDIDLVDNKPIVAPAKNAPLPPLPVSAGPSRVVDSVYAEISEAAVANNRRLLQDTRQAGQTSSQNPTYSLARPSYQDSTMAQEGMAKAQELAEEEGYELFLPAMQQQLRRKVPLNEESKSLDVTYPPVTTASALFEKYHINLHESAVRSRPFSESDVLTDKHGNAFGSSTPVDEVQSDEYVIVTGADRRPKLQFTGVAEENYAAVNSDNSSRLQAFDSSTDSQYSTPNPSLWSAGVSSVPLPQQTVPITRHSSAGLPQSTTTTTMTRQSSVGVPQLTTAAVARQSSAGHVYGKLEVPGSATPPLPPRRYDDEEGGINLEDMSPDTDPTYCNFERRSSSLGSSSGRSEGGGGGVAAEKGPPASMPVSCPTAAVKVMAGSPLDRSNSTELKNHARSHGNVLDHSPAPSPISSPSTTTTTMHSQLSSTDTSTDARSPSPPPSRVPLSPTSAKRHNYVNFRPKEGEELDDPVTRTRTTSSTPKNKRPRPLPRSSTLLRGDSVH